jgi:hypothetical protein
MSISQLGKLTNNPEAEKVFVEYLKTNEGCQVEVVSFGKSTSAKLIEATDDFTDLDQTPKKYLLR